MRVCKRLAAPLGVAWWHDVCDRLSWAATPRWLVAFLVLTWIDAIARGKRVAVYCSDVAGAFDRMSIVFNYKIFYVLQTMMKFLHC